MGLFSKKKDEKKVDSNFLIEAKDRIIASVKGDRSKVYEFVDDYGSTNSEDPEDVELRFIHALACICNPEGTLGAMGAYNAYYEPIKCNNYLYYTYKILKTLNIKFIDAAFDDKSIYRLVTEFATLLECYVNEKSYEEYISFDSNPCLNFANYVYTVEMTQDILEYETDYHKYVKYYILAYAIRCHYKEHPDVFEKDKFLLDDSFYAKPRRYGLEELLKDFRDSVTYKECLIDFKEEN